MFFVPSIQNEREARTEVLAIANHAKNILVGTKLGNDIQVVPNTMRRNSVRNLMCVGRYAEKM